MKTKAIKILLAFAAILIAIPAADAQVVKSKSYVKKTTITKTEDTNPWKKNVWYARAGISIPLGSGGYHNTITFPPGFDLDLGFQHRMGSKGWYWGMDIAFCTRSITIKDYAGEEGESAARAAFRVGLSNFGWRWRKGDFYTDVHIGLALECTPIGYDADNTSLYQSVWMVPIRPMIPIGFGVRWKMLSADLSIRPNFMPEAYCEYPDTPEYYDWEDDIYCPTMLLSVGVAF